MKTPFLKTALYSTLVVAGLSLSSCGNNNNQSEGDADNSDAMETTTESDNTPVMDTVVEDNDTVVKTGGGATNENAGGEQVP